MKPDSLMIDDVKYVREDSIKSQPTGNRVVVVVDRGWIFAGDIIRENGRIKLSRALHVRSWESIGFDGLIEQPLSSKVTLKSITDIDIPEISEVFCVPVHSEWGLK